MCCLLLLELACSLCSLGAWAKRSDFLGLRFVRAVKAAGGWQGLAGEVERVPGARRGPARFYGRKSFFRPGADVLAALRDAPGQRRVSARFCGRFLKKIYNTSAVLLRSACEKVSISRGAGCCRHTKPHQTAAECTKFKVLAATRTRFIGSVPRQC